MGAASQGGNGNGAPPGAATGSCRPPVAASVAHRLPASLIRLRSGLQDYMFRASRLGDGCDLLFASWKPHDFVAAVFLVSA